MKHEKISPHHWSARRSSMCGSPPPIRCCTTARAAPCNMRCATGWRRSAGPASRRSTTILAVRRRRVDCRHPQPKRSADRPWKPMDPRARHRAQVASQDPGVPPRSGRHRTLAQPDQRRAPARRRDEDPQTRRRSRRYSGRSSATGRSVDLRSLGTGPSGSPAARSPRPAEPPMPHRVAPRSPKPLHVNSIDRWV